MVVKILRIQEMENLALVSLYDSTSAEEGGGGGGGGGETHEAGQDSGGRPLSQPCQQVTTGIF
jgi:hypothetical protein